MTELDILSTILPVIVLLALGVLAAIASRELRLSPIVGYLVLGTLLGATGVVGDNPAIDTLANLGVVFLLFDIGLHFSFQHIREQARDIFGFGPLQIAFSTLGLAAIGLLFGLKPGPAFLIATTLSLSSTAVVARIIAERHQQNCPVGLTATAILVFQDVAAIFLLIVANALGTGADIVPTAAMAMLKAVGAFVVAVALSRFLVRPVFALVARTNNEEVFTAMALLVALAAGWATGSIGLSLTLGAFLGGTMLAESPYRPIIQSEIKPFRGLLLSFFFISVGLSIDLPALLHNAVWVVLGAVALVILKSVCNAGASLVFRWSVPGSTQLGMLIAQGSEFAFVIFSLPPVHRLIGAEASGVLMATVALTLALTPTLAELGRTLAGRMRARRQVAAAQDAELIPHDMAGPVMVVGLGPRGRTVADALVEFAFGYAAVERDAKRLREAIADGYDAVYGDMTDPRLWESVSLAERRVVVITEPDPVLLGELTPLAIRRFPHLKRIAVLDDPALAAPFRTAGLTPVMDLGWPPGLDAAMLVLGELGADPEAVAEWAARQRARVLGTPGDALVTT